VVECRLRLFFINPEHSQTLLVELSLTCITLFLQLFLLQLAECHIGVSLLDQLQLPLAFPLLTHFVDLQSDLFLCLLLHLLKLLLQLLLLGLLVLSGETKA